MTTLCPMCRQPLPTAPPGRDQLAHLVAVVGSVAALAERTGIHPTILSGLRTGRRTFTPHLATKLATALEMRHPASVLFPELVDALELSVDVPPSPSVPTLTVAQARALGERLGLHPAVLLWPELAPTLSHKSYETP